MHLIIIKNIYMKTEHNNIIERDCMNCEETFKTTAELNEDYCLSCRKAFYQGSGVLGNEI
jgi:protein-arginine kinase activator protein McsA